MHIRYWFHTSLLTLVFLVTSAQAQYDEPKGPDRLPWQLTVVTLDGVDPFNDAEIPVKEAIEFIEANSRFTFDVRQLAEYSSHELTPYHTGPDYDGDGRGDEFAYLMMGWNLQDSMTEALPPSTSYLFLYRLNGYRPLQAGSALPVSWGIKKRGIQRPYATIPTDQWWYKNEPYEGFQSRAAQIVTHELINTIQAKIEAPPYNCPQLIATRFSIADKYEAERLSLISGQCYAKLGTNLD